MSDLEWSRLFARAALEVANSQGTQTTLPMIAEYATRVTGCQWAAIAKATSTTPVVAATSDPAVGELIARLQASGGGGPTWEAVRSGHTIYVEDLTRERRWPEHVRELLATTPVRSLLAFSLQLDTVALGALTLYADHPQAFPPEAFDLASVYADHAAVALDHERAGSRAENLELALESNREIGVAIGILMERHKITTDQAFDMLRVASQHRHRKLRDIAADLVHTGQLDHEP